MRKNLGTLCVFIVFAGVSLPAAIATPTDSSDVPPVSVGETIIMVGPTFNVDVANVDDRPVEHCNLLQGDSIDIRKVDDNRLLLGITRLGNQDNDVRDNASGCPSQIIFFLTRDTYVGLRKGYFAVKHFTEGKIPAGETTMMVEPNISVTPVSLDDTELSSCNLLAGDTIELEVSTADFLLFHLVDTRKYGDEREESSGCPADTLFFFNRDQYTDARKKYLMAKDAEEHP